MARKLLHNLLLRSKIGQPSQPFPFQPGSLQRCWTWQQGPLIPRACVEVCTLCSAGLGSVHKVRSCSTGPQGERPECEGQDLKGSRI